MIVVLTVLHSLILVTLYSPLLVVLSPLITYQGFLGYRDPGRHSLRDSLLLLNTRSNFLLMIYCNIDSESKILLRAKPI